MILVEIRPEEEVLEACIFVLVVPPRLPDHNGVPGADGRGVLAGDGGFTLRGFYVPRPEGVQGENGSLYITGRDALDGLRDGEGPEALEFSGVLGGQYQFFHGIAISFLILLDLSLSIPALPQSLSLGLL